MAHYQFMRHSKVFTDIIHEILKPMTEANIMITVTHKYNIGIFRVSWPCN